MNKKEVQEKEAKAKSVVSIRSLKVKNPVKTAEVRRREQMGSIKKSVKSK